MRCSRLQSVSIAIVIFVFGACKNITKEDWPNRNIEDSEIQFAYSIEDIQKSHVKYLHDKRRMNFCLKTHNAPSAEVAEKIGEKIGRSLEEGTKQWAGALKEIPGWNAQDSIDFRLDFRSTCPKTAGLVTVNVEFDHNALVQKVKKSEEGIELSAHPLGAFYSHTLMGKKEMNISVAEFEKKGTELLTHELGHVLGLEDLYVNLFVHGKELAQKLRDTQPKSIMSGTSNKVTNHDALGVVGIWNGLKGRYTCPEGTVQSTEEVFIDRGWFVCLAKKSEVAEQSAAVNPAQVSIETKTKTPQTHTEPIDQKQAPSVGKTAIEITPVKFTFLKSSTEYATAEDKACGINGMDSRQRAVLMLTQKPQFVPPTHFAIKLGDGSKGIGCSRKEGFIYAPHLFGDSWKEYAQ